jgi:transcriptional regulator with XRE-family HTH domain
VAVAGGGGGRGRVEEVDRHVARRVRERRLALGITQGGLAVRLGTTPQQVHKYEAGANRLTVGRLHAAAEALGVDVGHFYEGLRAPAPSGQAPARGDRGGLALARNFAAIADPRRREALLALARALADDGDEAGLDTV